MPCHAMPYHVNKWSRFGCCLFLQPQVCRTTAAAFFLMAFAVFFCAYLLNPHLDSLCGMF